MSELVVKLDSKKLGDNNNSTWQISSLHNLLLIIIFYTPEKYLSNVDHKSDMRKVRTYSVKLLSTLFSCLIRAIYNIINYALKRLMLNSYIPGIIK